MPGSTAETRYGRRGGGWLPKQAAHPSTPARDGDPTCRVCDRPYSSHTAGPCPCCGLPLEHHTPEDVAGCWDGRARMAAARRAALDTPGSRIDDLGQVVPVAPTLDAVDVEALDRAGL